MPAKKAEQTPRSRNGTGFTRPRLAWLKLAGPNVFRFSIAFGHHAAPVDQNVLGGPGEIPRVPEAPALPLVACRYIVWKGLPKSQGCVVLTVHIFNKIIQRLQAIKMNRRFLDLALHKPTVRAGLACERISVSYCENNPSSSYRHM